jgi:hypothetical protein
MRTNKMKMVLAKKCRIRGFCPKWISLLIIVAVLGILPFISACDDVGRGLESTQERKYMELAKDSSSQTGAIPPIDTAAPANTETATFALG